MTPINQIVCIIYIYIYIFIYLLGIDKNILFLNKLIVFSF